MGTCHADTVPCSDVWGNGLGLHVVGRDAAFSDGRPAVHHGAQNKRRSAPPPTSSVTADSSPVKMCRVPDSATLPTTRHFAERGISALQREKSRKKWATQSARPKSETAASVPIDPANKSVSPSQVRDRSRQVTGCRERGQPPQPQPSKASLFGQAQSSAAARPGDRTPGEQGDT